jgi:heat shock protein HslJ
MIEAIALAALLQMSTPPYAGEWVVEIIDNIKVMPDSRVTIRIEGQTIAGSAPCNTYRGSFTVTGAADGVKVGQLLKTMKSCDPARMSEETDFFTLLGNASEYEVRGNDVLVLRTPTGKTITARRSTPSES